MAKHDVSYDLTPREEEGLTYFLTLEPVVLGETEIDALIRIMRERLGFYATAKKQTETLANVELLVTAKPERKQEIEALIAALKLDRASGADEVEVVHG